MIAPQAQKIGNAIVKIRRNPQRHQTDQVRIFFSLNTLFPFILDLVFFNHLRHIFIIISTASLILDLIVLQANLCVITDHCYVFFYLFSIACDFNVISRKKTYFEKWADDLFRTIFLWIVDFVTAVVKRCNAHGDKLAKTVFVMEYRQAYGHMLVIELLC